MTFTEFRRLRGLHESDRSTKRQVDALTYRAVLEKLQGIGKEYFRRIDNDLVTFRVCG